MKKAVIALAVVLALSMVAEVWAVEFSADVVTTTQGRTMNSKMAIKDKLARMEAQGQPGYTIMRGDKELVWIVSPAQKACMEMKLDANKKPKTEEKVQGEVSRKLLGKETIDKHPTEKYEITYTSQGKTEKMYQWMATDIKFPVKTAAVDGSWTTEYKNIRMGGQSDSIFECPAGYGKTAMPAMPKGMKMPKMGE
jgi:hypothetical protein